MTIQQLKDKYKAEIKRLNSLKGNKLNARDNSMISAKILTLKLVLKDLEKLEGC
jgi:hypothetical protein